MRLRSKLDGQRGFTLAEVLVAGLILVLALIPIVRMFDTSFAGIMSSSRVHKSVTLVQTIMERIKSMPYYVPYDAVLGKVDIDDHFWGQRSPLNANPSNGSGPDWQAIPEVTLPAYTYGNIEGNPEFRAGVKVCYQNDATRVSEMKNTWGPTKIGNDRPKDRENRNINLLVIQVNVYSMKDEVEVLEHRAEAIVTASEAVYNLGVSRITVDGPVAIQGTSSDAAAHWPERVANVTIEGWGFNPAAANFEVKLTRPDYNDITVDVNKVTSTDTVIRGTVRLYNSTPGSPWGGRAPIGFWSVKVRQDITSSYLYNGFICEYPRPIISDYGNDSTGPFKPQHMSKVGYKGWGTLYLRATGGRFINIVETPTVRLVQDIEENPFTVTGTVTSITAPNKGYTDSGCEIAASFDINEAPAGDYRIEVVNTQPEVVGHVSTLSGIYRIENPQWQGTIDDFRPNTGYYFYENYYDIPSAITGTNLSQASMVFIRSKDGTATYDITSACTLGGDTQIPVNLNLIACDNGKDWEVVICNPQGGFLKRDFDIALGPAVILPANNDPARSALRIRRYRYELLSWRDYGWSAETIAQKAMARRSTTSVSARAYFEVKGMGFPMNGQTYLRVWRGDYNTPSWSQSGNFSCVMDRNAKLVMISSGSDANTAWAMPNATGDCGIEVRRVGDPGATDRHNTRWVLGDT